MIKVRSLPPQALSGGQKSEARRQLRITNYDLRFMNLKSKIVNRKSQILLLLTVFLMLYPVISHAVLRGLPEGKSRIEVGDKAPLDTADLKKANEEGKVILLMFGNIDHCIYCEKMWGNIRDIMPQYNKDAAAILKTHRASKFWGPEDEAVKLGERYGVIGEPWLFIIDKKGIVRHIFMGFTGRTEIENEIKKALMDK
ncbi:MAG: thioredoxin family protein [Deltaproteobacteria bacterium]|nr:thioredoxin family protein [Deltaproteobacteria bacterium]